MAINKAIHDVSHLREPLRKLKILHYHTNILNSILAFMVRKNMTSIDAYSKIWGEYIEYYVKCQEYKNFITINYLFPEFGRFDGPWEIDFGKEEIYIYEKV